jgi:predicted transcriptional regulator
MATSLTELAANIAAAQASKTRMSAQEISQAIQSAYDTLVQLKAAEDANQPLAEVGLTQADEKLAALQANPKRSIQQNKVFCLECGASFTVLSGKHLESHGLTAKEYRKKWQLGAKQGLASKAFSQKRRDTAHQLGLGDKLAASRKTRAAKQKGSGPKNAAEPLRETDAARVINIIREYKDGVSISRLVDRTGFNTTKVRNIVSIALKKGQLTRVARGAYKAI